MPGGQPSTTQPIAGPCDSPNEVNENSVPNVLPDMVQRAVRAIECSTRFEHVATRARIRHATHCHPAISSLRSRGARFVAVLTGAGVSAESGVPTFRDAQTGLWAKFDPRELATPSAFARNPKRVWDWYAERRAMVASVRAQSRALRARRARAARARRSCSRRRTSTACIAAPAASRVVELHGNITRVKCSRAGAPVDAWDEPADGRAAALPRVRRVPAARRRVVRGAAACRRAGRGRARRRARCDVLLVVGTSAEVYPAAALPEHARRGGACVVEINPNATPLTAHADHALRGPAGVVLPALVGAAFPRSLAQRSRRQGWRAASRKPGEDQLAVGRYAKFAVARLA